MGTNTALHAEPSHLKEPLVSMEEEKVCNIVEVCNVSREEAIRVLHACHMDETMAIERFLSGTGVWTWSQVSKKKRPVQHPRSGSRDGNSTRNQDRRDRDIDRREKYRIAHHASNSNEYRRSTRQHSQQSHHQAVHTQHGCNENQKEIKPGSSLEKVSAEDIPVSCPDPISQSWGPPAHESWAHRNGPSSEVLTASHTHQQDAWQNSNPDRVLPQLSEITYDDSVKSAGHVMGWVCPDSSTVAPALKEGIEVEVDSTSVSSPIDGTSQSPSLKTASVKRTVNYAAAVAAGTSHEKHASITSDISPSLQKKSPLTSCVRAGSNCVVAVPAEDISPTVCTDPDQRLSKTGRKKGSDLEHDYRSPEAGVASSQAKVILLDPFNAGNSGVRKSPCDGQRGTLVAEPKAWGTLTPSDQEADAVTGNIVSAVTSTEGNTGEMLSLQFGSFGLGGLNDVNWADEKASDASSTIAIASHSSTVPSTTTMKGSGKHIQSKPSTAALGISSKPGSTSSTGDQATAIHASSDISGQGPATLISASLGPTGSGMFPVHPLAPGTSFPLPSFGNPYMIPPLHPYSPAINSFENQVDLTSPRTSNLAPHGSIPLYDPSAIPAMPSSQGKYGGIPGLGDVSALPPVMTGMGKDISGSISIDKNAQGTSGLPVGMDPLATPYVVPGYASMQYPHLYTFPNAGYPPPGMGPPGASPFPYPQSAQVPNQGARMGFGFDDGSTSVGGNRTGAGLGESMYAPGGYLGASMGQSGSQKTPSDGTFKQGQSNAHPIAGLGGVGMAGGVVHGMTYGDYTGTMAGVGSNVTSNVGGAETWNSGQAANARPDGGMLPVPSSPSVAGVSNSSTLYASGPLSAPAGSYWNAQHGGYYS